MNSTFTIDSREDVGTALAALREGNGLTQQDVADVFAAGHCPAISRWEHGGHVPRLDMLVDILKWYGYEMVFRKRK